MPTVRKKKVGRPSKPGTIPAPEPPVNVAGRALHLALWTCPRCGSHNKTSSNPGVPADCPSCAITVNIVVADAAATTTP